MKAMSGKSFSLTTTWLCAVCLALMLTMGCSSNTNDPEPPADPVRETTQGPVRGVEEDTLLAFRGIPYAAPPVGALRFAPPEPAPERADTLDAREFCSACPQVGGSFGATSYEEDCLYLNIFTPKGDGPYPVMVWIHGGAFIVGSGADPGYDATRLVAEDVILVTVNYRLGALGFLPHAALTAENPAVGSGNYGLMDQQAALQWIQANIAPFGGDPENVTLFGESAGGHSVMSHLVSPTAEGLFHRVIVQSGSYNPGQLPLMFGEALVGTPFTISAGCTSADPAETAACLRDLSVEDVLTAQGDAWYLPMTGTAILPESIYQVLEDGDLSPNVPVLIGSNLHEGRLFVALDMLGGDFYHTEGDYVAAVGGLLSEDMRPLDAGQIADDYLGFEDPLDANKFRRAFAAIQTDWRFTCSNLKQWYDLSAVTDTYAYWFTDVNAPNDFDAHFGSLLPMAATHTLEIQYAFGTVGHRGGTDDQVALSEAMIGFWTRFAKTGNPNPAATTVWDNFTALGGFVLELNAPAPAAADAAAFSVAHHCTYWAAPPLQ
ncbi:MAG: carboxylesterase family protein [Desulfatitalea sp.]|nr:carboxylesterase family protein [Desulfatitalea sp.]